MSPGQAAASLWGNVFKLMGRIVRYESGLRVPRTATSERVGQHPEARRKTAPRAPGAQALVRRDIGGKMAR
jgi:hypothetical protein